LALQTRDPRDLGLDDSSVEPLWDFMVLEYGIFRVVVYPHSGGKQGVQIVLGVEGLIRFRGRGVPEGILQASQALRKAVLEGHIPSAFSCI
jgi:hypothetical protein